MEKKYSVVLLPSDNDSVLIQHGNELKAYPKPMNKVNNDLAIPQFLYYVSDEEIKINDWYIDDANQVRISSTSDKEYWAERKNYRKIVATSNPELWFVDKQRDGIDKPVVNYKESLIPKISTTDIEAYAKACNEGNVIKQLMLEMIEEGTGTGHHDYKWVLRLKSGCVISHPIVEETVSKSKYNAVRDALEKINKECIENGFEDTEINRIAIAALKL